MIKRPTISIVYDRRHVASNTKAASIEVRASYNGQSIYFNTGAAVRANEWRNGRVVRRDDMDALNKRIAAMYDNVSAKIDELLAANCYTNANLKAAILDGYKPKQEMWQWIEQRINERPLGAATKRQHLSCMSVIKEMGSLRQWSDLTLANIKRIDERLRASGLSQTTIYSYHKRLKPYLRDAVIFGMIAASPYDQFKTPHGASKRIKYLTAAECAKLEAASMPTATLQHAKDVWLYQRYTGLAYADLANLRSDNYIRDDGGTYIITSRQKNGAQVAIRLIDKALAIYNAYNGKLPVVNLSSYNAQLKQVALIAGIKKTLTSHMARHTFATQALHAGVAIEVVSKMLSHADIHTTQIYAKVLADDVMAAFDKLNETK